MSDTTVLVTGGAGYVGSHACKALSRYGYQPVVFDSLEAGHAGAVKWGPLETGTLLDRARLTRVVRRYRPAAVMHFAAYAYVQQSVHDPGAYYHNNVAGTINLLDVVRENEIGAMIFSSTCAIYGIPESMPIREDSTRNPINPYGRSKLMVECILADYAQAYGLSACSLRYFNAAGADPDGEIGELHEPEPHLIPNVLRSAAGRGAKLKVFGDDYPTRDGTCIRDFIHVTDLADAHCRALRYIADNPGCHAFNLGSEQGYSILEVIKMAESETGLPVPYTVEGRRPGDPPILVADSTRAREELGWERRHSGLGEILRTAWQWQRSGTTLE